MRRLGSLVFALLLTACASTSIGPTSTTTGLGIVTQVDYTPPPGAYNPAVTQATIRTTICVRGWTATVRPPVSYTSPLKVLQMKVRHLPGSPSAYEEDHMVPLELGGAPKDPLNLWPEPRTGPHASSSVKDSSENSLKAKVCSGALTLDQARKLIVDPSKWGNV